MVSKTDQQGIVMNFLLRLDRLRAKLKTLPCDAFLVEHPIDLFYLTGLELSTGKLIVTADHASLIVDGRYYERCCRQTVYPVQLLQENIFQEWIVDKHLSRLGFDQDHTTYQRFLNLKQLAEKMKSASFNLEIVPLESPVQELRLIKDPEEILALKKAAHLGYQGYEFISSILREGVTEAELAFELEFFWRKRGGSRLAFDPIIAFGPNSSMPHYRAGATPLTYNTYVLIDIGVVVENYHSDMTRVVYFGTPDPTIKKIYRIVEEAKERAMELCRPGTLIGDLDRTARQWIASKGYEEYFNHGLGHGVGLDIHEPPSVKANGADREMPLKAGMVITIEPGIYLPGIGGVRLEDTILITENGFENLTVS